MVEQAKNGQPDENFFVMDFTKKWDFENEKLDLVVGMASFHHILKKSEQRAFMAEAFRTMKSGGALVLTTWVLPKKHFWKNVLRGRFKVWNVPFGKEKHPRFYRKVNGKELTSLAKEAGFVIKKMELSRGKNWVLLAVKP
jgi:SAM-dependent methyltransferase